MLLVLAIFWGRYFIYKSPYKRLEIFGKAIHQALLDSGQIETKESAPRVVKDSKQAIYNAIYLKGASMREKEIFAQTMTEFFAPIENQRYILKACHKVKDQTEFLPFQVCLKSERQMQSLSFDIYKKSRKI